MAQRRLPYLELFPDSAGEWRWHVRASNGRITDSGGEGFASKSNAKRAGLRQHPELKERIRDLTPRFKSA